MFSSSVSILPSLRHTTEDVKRYSAREALNAAALPSGVELLKSSAKILRFVLFGETLLLFIVMHDGSGWYFFFFKAFFFLGSCCWMWSPSLRSRGHPRKEVEVNYRGPNDSCERQWRIASDVECRAAHPCGLRHLSTEDEKEKEKTRKTLRVVLPKVVTVNAPSPLPLSCCSPFSHERDIFLPLPTIPTSRTSVPFER